MFIDLSIEITPEMGKTAAGHEKKVSFGHMGTHFDTMNKAFPLEMIERRGLIFDVRFAGRDIGVSDVDLTLVERDMFVAFCTGFISEEPYGTKAYFKEHPQLSNELIEALLGKKVSIIAIDAAGIRRGVEHTPMDQHCADHGVFVVENLCNLEEVLGGQLHQNFTAHTYPIRYTGITGVPCRVVAEV